MRDVDFKKLYEDLHLDHLDLQIQRQIQFDTLTRQVVEKHSPIMKRGEAILIKNTGITGHLHGDMNAYGERQKLMKI